MRDPTETGVCFYVVYICLRLVAGVGEDNIDTELIEPPGGHIRCSAITVYLGVECDLLRAKDCG